MSTNVLTSPANAVLQTSGRIASAVAARGGRIGRGVLGIAIFVGIWAITASATSSPLLIPSPLRVFHALQENFIHMDGLAFIAFGSGGILSNLTYTVENVLIGVALGTAVGWGLGVLVGRIRLAREALEPILLVMGTVPVLVLLPFLFLWFGTSRFATNGLVIFYAAVTVAIVVQEATMSASGRFEQFAISLGASRSRALLTVVIPAIAPDVLGGIRVALAFGWGFQTIAEVIGGQVGAGRVIRVFSVLSSTPGMIGVVICVGLVGVLLDAIVAQVGRWMLRWQE